jgi:hypothetical protein
MVLIRVEEQHQLPLTEAISIAFDLGETLHSKYPRSVAPIQWIRKTKRITPGISGLSKSSLYDATFDVDSKRIAVELDISWFFAWYSLSIEVN